MRSTQNDSVTLKQQNRKAVLYGCMLTAERAIVALESLQEMNSDFSGLCVCRQQSLTGAYTSHSGRRSITNCVRLQSLATTCGDAGLLKTALAGDGRVMRDG